MNTILFLSGLGVGVLITSLLVIAFLGYAARKAVNNKEQIELLNKQHDELIAIHRERNRLVALQTSGMCVHRNVTVTEDGGRCDRCRADVTFNKETKNWE